MLFSQERTILYISKEKIIWVLAKIPAGKIIGQAHDLLWSEDNLRRALFEIRDKFPKILRIVIGEEWAYVMSLEKNEAGKQTEISVRSRIPENSNIAWDAKAVAEGTAQVMAVQENFLSGLKKVISESGLRAEAVEIESVSISRLMEKKKEGATLFLKKNGKVIFGAIENGAVIFTKIFSRFPAKNEIGEFLEYVSGKTGSSFQDICVSGATEEESSALREFNLNVEKSFLEPLAGIAQKKDIRGKDENVLNINLAYVEKEDKKEKDHKRGRREKILLIIFIADLVLGALAIYFILRSRQKTPQKNQTSAQIQRESSSLIWQER